MSTQRSPVMTRSQTGRKEHPEDGIGNARNVIGSKVVQTLPLDAVPLMPLTDTGLAGATPAAQSGAGGSIFGRGNGTDDRRADLTDLHPGIRDSISQFSTTSKRSTYMRQQAKLRAMEEKAAIDEEARRQRHALIDMRLSVEEAPIKAEDEHRSIPSAMGEDSRHESVRNWLDESEKRQRPTTSPQPSITANTFSNREASSLCDSSSSRRCSRSNTSNRPTRAKELAETTRILVDAMSQLNLKREEKLDYRSVCRMLPTFSGTLGEWLAFKRAYDDSKKIAKFSKEENMARLRQCLKGEAKESVGALLSLAENPDDIVEALEMKFAHPVTIIEKVERSIRDLPSMSNEGYQTQIIDFTTTVQNSLAILRVMKNHQDHLRCDVHHLITSKFPSVLSNEYGNYLYTEKDGSESRNTLLLKFLKKEVYKARILLSKRPPLQKKSELHGRSSAASRGTRNSRINAVRFDDDEQNSRSSTSSQRSGSTNNKRSGSTNNKRSGSTNKRSGSTNQQRSSSTKKCDKCEQSGHRITQCNKFKGLSTDDRWKWVKENPICFACLQKGHLIRACRNRVNCGKDGCTRKHHVLLHGTPKTTNTETIEKVAATNMGGSAKLKIIPVELEGPAGKVQVYAMLDDAATATILNKSIAKKIGARGKPLKDMTVKTMRSETTEKAERVELRINRVGNGTTYPIRAYAVDDVDWGTQSIENIARYPHLAELDSELYTYCNATPDILIGQDHPDLIAVRDIRVGRTNEPYASKTLLGWVVHGYWTSPSGASRERIHHVNIDLHEMVKKSYEIDALGVSTNKRVNHLEQRSLEVLRDTTTHTEDDRWETGLLWKNSETSTFPPTRDMALKRLKTLQKKMNKDECYATRYENEIKKLVDKGYAEECHAPPSASTRSWYLPHFGVENPNKPNKLRIVFDAAARVGGKSLNDYLLTGPDLLNSLFAILMRFREGKYAMTADIREMFLRIKIRVSERDALRFLWTWNASRGGDVKEYRMTSLIFGATCAPTTAIYVKNENAKKFADEFPDAAEITHQDFYMDDLVHSTDLEEKAIQVSADLIELHRRGGFELTGWASNSATLLSSLNPDYRSQHSTVALMDADVTEKILGIIWEPSTDQLRFNLTFARISPQVLSGETKPTKRQVLSIVMSVFDPVGLASPVIIRGRILLQDIWRSEVTWDEPINERDYEKWRCWLTDMNELKTVKIPRHYGGPAEHIELHTFTDASEQAYGATAYFVLASEEGRRVVLVASKARVAPLRPISIPRMELQAALLGARLANTIEKEHRLIINTKYFWTDARTALAWIKTDPRDFKAFVAHRVGEIDELTDRAAWRWVPTAENPADLTTRDTGDLRMGSDDIWLTGPAFLRRAESEWPAQPQAEPDNAGLDEKKPQHRVNVINIESHTAVPEKTRFSSWQRLLRTTAQVLLFIDKLRKRAKELHRGHLDLAERLILQQSQEQCFAQEKADLLDGRNIRTDSKLRELRPAIASDGLIRLQGRIRKANVKKDLRTPVILDGDNYITKLLVLEYHKKALHAGNEKVINEIRQKYWILRLRPTVRSVARRCQACRIIRASATTPPTADLPVLRLQHHHRPFTNTGLDYFGPLEVTVGRRHEKRWCALFTCLTTRAVHLESAASLNTDSAIMALRRFMARRGTPAVILSDNGSNFHGADNELKKSFKEINQDELKNFAINKGVEWRFNPAFSPHMGGAWERLVRSVKTALRVILRERAPKDEVLTTLLAEAEYSVNSRPLTHVSVDPRDPEALTPNHFLLGSSSGLPTSGSFDNTDLITRKQWRTAQRLADMFWARWVREYLPLLQPRAGEGTGPDLKEGDIVFIADPGSPRNTWPRGLVSKTYPGDDGRVRIVEVKTTAGVYKRSARNVIALPTDHLE